MDFESMTVSQLKDIARANNLKNWSKLKKAGLIQFLVNNVPRGARVRSHSPRGPRPRSRSPSPRPPSRGRSPRRGPLPVAPRGPFGVAKLKKRQCDKNLRKDVVAVAEDYGIAITKAGGKKKTIKELCAEMDVVVAQRPPMPIAATPPKTRSPSPVRGAVGMARPPTPPILDFIPAGGVPRAIVYSLTNIDRDMTKTELLDTKRKLVSKDKMVLYAAEFGIRGKSLTKPILLDRIIAAQIARNMPIVAQAIEAESVAITDEIVDRVSERVEATGVVPPNEEEIQVVVEQRVSTGEVVNPAAIAAEIVAEQQSEDIIESTRRSSSPSSRSSSSMSSIAQASVESSVSVARSISNRVAEDIVDEVKDRTDIDSVKRTIDEVVEEQGINLDIDPNRLEEIVSDEQAREAVESVVVRATNEGLISENEGEEILQPLLEEVSPVAGPSGVGGARPKTRTRARIPDRRSVSPRPPPPVKRQIRGEQDIENMLREIQKPEESISNMPVIKQRVFRCLGLVN